MMALTFLFSITALSFSVRNISDTSKKQKIKNLVGQFFNWFDAISNSTLPLRYDDLRKYFDKDIRHTVNGRLITIGLANAYRDLLKLRNNGNKIQIYVKDISINGNKIAIVDDVQVTNKNGGTLTNHVTELWELKDGKIFSIIENISPSYRSS